MNKKRIAFLCLLVTVVFAFNVGLYFFNLYEEVTATPLFDSKNPEVQEYQNSTEPDTKSLEILSISCRDNLITVSVKSNATMSCEPQWKAKVLMDNKIETCTIADKSINPGETGTFTFKLRQELKPGEVYPVNVINNDFLAKAQCIAA